jgi:hypothetical protein
MLEIKKLQTPQNSICEAFSAFITYNPGSKFAIIIPLPFIK